MRERGLLGARRNVSLNRFGQLSSKTLPSSFLRRGSERMFLLSLTIALSVLISGVLGAFRLKENNYIATDVGVETYKSKVYNSDGTAYTVSISDITETPDGATAEITMKSVEFGDFTESSSNTLVSFSLFFNGFDQPVIQGSDQNKESTLSVGSNGSKLPFVDKSKILVGLENVDEDEEYGYDLIYATPRGQVTIRSSFSRPQASLAMPEGLVVVLDQPIAEEKNVVYYAEDKENTAELVFKSFTSAVTLNLTESGVAYTSDDGAKCVIPYDRLDEAGKDSEQEGARQLDTTKCIEEYNEPNSVDDLIEQQKLEMIRRHLDIMKVAYGLAKGSVYIGQRAPPVAESVGAEVTGDWVDRHAARSSLIKLDERMCVVFGGPFQNGTTWTTAGVFGVCEDENQTPELVRMNHANIDAHVRYGALPSGAVVPGQKHAVHNMVGDYIAVSREEEAEDLHDTPLGTTKIKGKGKISNVTGLHSCHGGDVVIDGEIQCIKQNGNGVQFQSVDLPFPCETELEPDTRLMGYKWPIIIGGSWNDTHFCSYDKGTCNGFRIVENCVDVTGESYDDLREAFQDDVPIQQLEVGGRISLIQGTKGLYVINYEYIPFINLILGVEDYSIAGGQVYMQNKPKDDDEDLYSYHAKFDHDIFTKKIGTISLLGKGRNGGSPIIRERVKLKYARTPFTLEAQMRRLMKNRVINSVTYKHMRDDGVIGDAVIQDVRWNKIFTNNTFAVSMHSNDDEQTKETYIVPTVNGNNGDIMQKELIVDVPSNATDVYIKKDGSNCVITYYVDQGPGNEQALFIQRCKGNLQLMLPIWAIVLIAIGILIVLGILFVSVFLCCKKKDDLSPGQASCMA